MPLSTAKEAPYEIFIVSRGQSIDKSQSTSDDYDESSKNQPSISEKLKNDEKELKKALGSRRYKQLSQLSSLFTQETEEINPDASNQPSNN